jgi:uncharacterized RDD family membrane protein YckC
MSETQSNPYAPPTTLDLEASEVTEYSRLASRLLRLAATILDNIFAGLVMVPVMLSEPFREVLLSDGWDFSEFTYESKDWIYLGITSVLGIAFLVWNLILLAKRGQTVGKMCCGIKIVRTDYTKASFSRVFWLRAVVNALISAIPAVGNIYALVDVLFIFGEERKCLHDMFAGTIVVYTK